MKFCANCGCSVNGMKFCPECGNPVIEDIPDQNSHTVSIIQNEESRNKKMRYNLILLGSVFAVVIIATAWINLTNSPLSLSSQKNQVVNISESDFKSSCITKPYEDLARHPDLYKGEPLVINGTVSQVIDNANSINYRIANGDNHDEMIYATYSGDFDHGRILEGDNVILWGIFDGLTSYRSTLGEKITIPSLSMKYYIIN